MSKKTAAFLMCILMITLCFLLTACDTPQSSYTLKLVSTTLSAGAQNNEHLYTIQWDNRVFMDNPSDFSPTLARTAMVLSATAYDHKLINENLSILGFDKKAKFNYSKNYDPNAIGVVIASKQINDFTVISITLRGTYQKEWYSNFKVGTQVDKTGVHQGFEKASRFIMKKVDEYIFNYDIDKKDTKFILTGHSRGAAVANLSAAYLIDNYGKNNVYAYTFATPNTTTSKLATNEKYSGIFNFVNPEDFICYIPLQSWGFTKYGTTITFPDSNTTGYDNAIQQVSVNYENFTDSNFKSFGSVKKLNDFLDTAYSLSPSIYDYYNKKYEVAGLEMSMYDYMMTVAYVLNNEDPMTNGLILMGSDDTAFEPIKNYLMSGMDTKRSMLALDYENSLIGYAHTTQTYLAWLEYYIENL